MLTKAICPVFAKLSSPSFFFHSFKFHFGKKSLVNTISLIWSGSFPSPLIEPDPKKNGDTQAYLFWKWQYRFWNAKISRPICHWEWYSLFTDSTLWKIESGQWPPSINIIMATRTMTGTCKHNVVFTSMLTIFKSNVQNKSIFDGGYPALENLYWIVID